MTPQERVRFELAGLRLDLGVPAGALRVPENLRVASGWLVWPEDGAADYREPTRDILPAFLKLESGDPLAIQAFARQWGPLGRGPAKWSPKNTKLFGEPLTEWATAAQRAQALLQIAARLHRGERVRQEEVEKAAGIGRLQIYRGERVRQDGGIGTADIGRYYSTLTRTPAELLALFLTAWMLLGSVQPALRVADDRPLRFQLLWHGGVYGVIGLHLALAVSKSETLAICDGCNKVFIPKRKPAVGRRAFCEECGIETAWRFAAQDKRERDRRSRRGRNGRGRS